MRSLAKFIMRGRVESILVALVGGWIPLLSQAALGLVTLRKGWQEGFLVTIWAALPMILSLSMSDIAPVMVAASLAVIVVAYGASIFLRITFSWAATSVAIAIFSALAAIVTVGILGDGAVSEVRTTFGRMLQAQSESQGSQQMADVINAWGGIDVSGFIACCIFVSSLAGLVLSRWWQAMLFNEGGFKQEFHAMRTNAALVVLSVFANVACLVAGAEWQLWSAIAIAPLIFIGLGLAHWLVDRYKLGYFPLSMLYVGLIMMPGVVGLLLAILAISDVWVNYRSRLHIRP